MKIIIFSLFLVFSFLTKAQSVEQNLQTLNSQLKAVEGMLDSVPYKHEQHLAIESYFRNLNSFTLNVKAFSNSSRWLNTIVSRSGVDSLCKNIFLDLGRWNDLIKNCTINGFFLCAEEVRAYPTLRKTLKDTLRADLKKSFEDSKICNAP